MQRKTPKPKTEKKVQLFDAYTVREIQERRELFSHTSSSSSDSSS